MTSTKNLKEKFEEEIKLQKEEGKVGKKERVWTPHESDEFRKQTTVKYSGNKGGPPPKKNISDLP